MDIIKEVNMPEEKHVIEKDKQVGWLSAKLDEKLGEDKSMIITLLGVLSMILALIFTGAILSGT